MDDRAPLTGVTVVDLSSTFMGPYCTMLLAQWGADVIKVEPQSGDVVRYIGDVRQTGMGPVFLNVNRGKRSIALDLKHADIAQVMECLVAQADVFVHNVRPSAAKRLGIAADDIMRINPSVVYCGFRGFGAGGPYEDRPAYDDVIQAASGMAALQGGTGDPEYVRGAVADKTVGLMGAAAILAALHGRQRTGRGEVVEVPMLEAMTSFTLLEQQGGWVFDPPLGPTGYARTKSPHRKPYRTKDGLLAIMVYTDEQWRSFFDVIGRSDLALEPHYQTIRDRTIHIDELYNIVNTVMATRSTSEWHEILVRADIPAAPVNTISDLFSDPHLHETDFFERVEHPTEGTLRQARPPVVLSGMPQLRPAPRLGEHTFEVLSELGFDAAHVRRLMRADVITALEDPVSHQVQEEAE